MSKISECLACGGHSYLIGLIRRAGVFRCRHCGITYPRILKPDRQRAVEPSEPTQLDLFPRAAPVPVAEGIVRFENDCGETTEMRVSVPAAISSEVEIMRRGWDALLEEQDDPAREWRLVDWRQVKSRRRAGR